MTLLGTRVGEVGTEEGEGEEGGGGRSEGGSAREETRETRRCKPLGRIIREVSLKLILNTEQIGSKHQDTRMKKKHLRFDCHTLEASCLKMFTVKTLYEFFLDSR